MKNIREFNHQRGSVLVEFLFCFPAFILICLFLFEVCLISVDKHIVRLATFEAARVYAATDRVDYGADGAMLTDPCQFPAAKSEARLAAIKKLASIAPQVDTLLAKALPGVGSSVIGSISSVIGEATSGFAKRIIMRWFSASFLTEIKCQYDAPNNLINVEVKYQRLLETPVVNRMIYLMHKLFESNKDATEVDFDPIIEETKVLLTDDQKKDDIKNILEKADSAKAKLAAIAAIEKLIGESSDEISLPILNIIPSENPSQKIKSSINQLVQIAKVAAVFLNLEPEYFWQLPLTSKVSLSREFQTAQLKFVADSAQADPWVGNMKGTMLLEGPHRQWAHELSNPSKYLEQEKDKVK